MLPTPASVPRFVVLGLLHSELLGHVKGSFTGSASERIGKFQAADQGTLFLDEVESMPKAGQDFLLDLLDGSGSFAPLGAQPSAVIPRPIFRLISASKTALSQTSLRPDLTQRLATGEMILLPCLGERKEDLPALVAGFLTSLRQEQGVNAEFTTDALEELQVHHWPGEIRELEATIRTLALHEHSTRDFDGQSTQRIVLNKENVRHELERRRAAFGWTEPSTAKPQVLKSQSVRKRPMDVSPEEARRALSEHAGNKTHAAKSLGMSLNSFKARLNRPGFLGGSKR